MISIPRHLIDTRFARSGGAGGQHVNKTETKAEIRFHVDTAFWIPEKARARFKNLYANRINAAGEFILSSETTRSQGRNLEDCFTKLGEFLNQVEREPKVRRKTKPSRGSQERRITSKKKSGATKKGRQGKWD